MDGLADWDTVLTCFFSTVETKQLVVYAAADLLAYFFICQIRACTYEAGDDVLLDLVFDIFILVFLQARHARVQFIFTFWLVLFILLRFFFTFFFSCSERFPERSADECVVPRCVPFALRDRFGSGGAVSTRPLLNKVDSAVVFA